MTSCTMTRTLCLLLLTALSAVQPAPPCPEPSRPNIILIMADQMRADMPGSPGNKLAITPNLDRLAAQGVRYRNAYSSTPTCTPARSAILTGLSPWYHGMLGYGKIAQQYPYEMPRVLSDAGYYTISIGKDHFGWNEGANMGTPHGYNVTQLYDGLPEELDDYDQWIKDFYPGIDPMKTGLEYNDYRGAIYALPEYFHPTAWVGRSAVGFLKSYNESIPHSNCQPFFMKASFHRPHSPYDPPKRWMDQFDPHKMPEPFIGNWDWNYAVQYRELPPPEMWAGDIAKAKVQKSRQAYYASSGFVDEWIGIMLDTLDSYKLSNNTFIMFTADHGDMLGDHYLWRKGYPYFGSANVPMIVRWPPSMDASKGGSIIMKRGSVMDHVTELRDIFPTALDVAGIPVTQTLNGSSILKTLRQEKGFSWRKRIDLEHNIVYNATVHWNAITDGHWKYIFQAYDGSELLFNLDLDPHEHEDVSQSETEVLEKWRRYMVKQFEEEERGEEWVRDGKLMVREQSILYSPHYPDPEGAMNSPPWVMD